MNLTVLLLTHALIYNSFESGASCRTPPPHNELSQTSEGVARSFVCSFVRFIRFHIFSYVIEKVLKNVEMEFFFRSARANSKQCRQYKSYDLKLLHRSAQEEAEPEPKEHDRLMEFRSRARILMNNKSTLTLIVFLGREFALAALAARF